MKNLLLILLLATFTNSWLCEASSLPEPVLDLNGKILRTHTMYYIVPINRVNGGLAVETIGNETCQLGVVKEKYDKNGDFLEFIPLGKKKGVIRVLTDLNVAIFSNYECRQSTVWQLEKYDPSTRKYFVNVGGVDGNPGPQTIRNWFKIDKYGHGYKFVYCPSVCTYCKVICKDVGVYMLNGQNRLALNDVPFVFNFKREFNP
ncbi:miraculin-like [Solanum dulcamara]|uniref:miraculin-like n=1 Tax=Solanum dulcamara TaxID=45834 RepID=UPI002484F536|nr:miraculin-like [Solanum dulcamara]